VKGKEQYEAKKDILKNGGMGTIRKEGKRKNKDRRHWEERKH